MKVKEYILNKYREIRRPDYLQDCMLKCGEKLNYYLIKESTTEEQYVYVFKMLENYFKEYEEIFKYLHQDRNYYVWYNEVRPSMETNSSKRTGKLNNKQKRQIIKERDGNKCVLCQSEENLTVDHINPYSRSKDNTYYNLMTLCNNCNQQKRNKCLPENFIKETLIPIIKNEATK